MIVSFRHDKERTTKRRRIIGVLFIFAIGVFLVRASVAEKLGGVLADIGGPIWRIEDVIAERINDVRVLFTSKFALEEENRLLKEQMAAFALRDFSNEVVRQENSEFKRALGRAPEHSLLLARVLSNPASSPYDTLVIDVGSRHGVTSGMLVFVDGDFLVGEVVRVWEDTALVQLYSAPGSTVSVVIGPSSTPALAHGSGGGNFRMTLPKGLAIPVGSMVVFPALSEEYAGVIGGVINPEGSSLQTLLSSLPFNVHEIQWVYVADPAVVSTSSSSPLLL